MKDTFYLTTAIPYVNAAPHIGHALEFVQADTIARYHRLLGEEVCLLSGADENALKNVQAAASADIPIQKFIDTNSDLFLNLAGRLNVRFDVFQKGSDQIHHFPSSQKLWKLCEARGDIYKKTYEGLYCLGCEAFYTPDELNEHGECNEHPGKKLELVKEENYFFRLSNYQQRLIELIQQDTIRIIPEFRKHEILSFLKQPLLDISVSRTNERAKNWGVPVPGDPSQRIYVWFDALNIYQSGIGFGWDEPGYEHRWPADVHVIGKGITRFHAVYWPAFLLSAGLALPKTILVHGYLTVDGAKMSKTVGNVIDPGVFIDRFGTDALRYYLLREIPPFDDGDVSERRFRELYNADLANGLGNLVARVAKLAQSISIPRQTLSLGAVLTPEYQSSMESYRFNDALAAVWKLVKQADKHIDETTPWKKSGADLEEILYKSIASIQTIALLLQPFMPETSARILEQFNGPAVQPGKPLFPRIT